MYRGYIHSSQKYINSATVYPGLASPGPIASALWTDPELEADVCLDAILTVCDATNIRRQLADEREDGAINEAQEQIAYADIILCNKVGKGQGRFLVLLFAVLSVEKDMAYGTTCHSWECAS